MALDDDIAVLSQAPLFNLLERDALRLVAFASESRSYREGDVLFKRGDRSDGGYVVSRGTIALDASEDGAPEAFLAGPGSLIGQAALFARVERRATATAREPSSIIRVTPSLMRRVLVDFARAGKNQKRGGAMQRITFDQDLPVAGGSPEDLIAIDEALAAFSKEYERKAQVVELRFFGGLSVEETAEVLTISPETVMRDWKFAKNWLMRELSRAGARHA